jgi:hypothetical protein
MTQRGAAVRRAATAALVLLVIVLGVQAGSSLVGRRGTGPGETTPPPSTPTARPSRAPAPTPVPTPQPRTAAADELVPTILTWWDTTPVSFGSPPQGVAPPPPDYTRLRVGTLDGRVVADLTLSATLAFAAGPYGTDVLAGHDNGAISELFVISALGGGRRNILLTDAIVPIASFGLDGSLYFVRVDRETGVDQGVWVLPPVGGTEQPLVAGPLAELPWNETARWHMAWTPDRTALAVQACNAVRCRTHVIDPASATMRSTDLAGTLLGMTGTELLARAQGARLGMVAYSLQTFSMRDVVAGAVAAVPFTAGGRAFVAVDDDGALRATDVVGGEPFEVPESDIGAAQLDGELQPPDGERGVALPAGWLLLWPRLLAGDAADPMSEAWGNGTLLNAITGERLEVPAPDPVVARAECQLIAPRVLPSGAAPGPSVVTVDRGAITQTWGIGEHRLVEATGSFVIGAPSAYPSAPPLTMRGQPAKAVVLGDEGIDELAIIWEEGGCPYTLWLPAGTRLADAIAYAARF